MKNEKVVRALLPTRFGMFEIYGFKSKREEDETIAVVKGPLGDDSPPLVRIHSQCFTGDTLHSLRCDCGEQLEEALRQIQASGSGLLIYQMQEGRGIGLFNKLRAYQLQDKGIDTVDANVQLGFEADQRSYGSCARVLEHFGVTRIRLMSNNPKKIVELEAEGVEVVERIPLVVAASALSQKYLKVKKEKLGHLLD